MSSCAAINYKSNSNAPIHYSCGTPLMRFACISCSFYFLFYVCMFLEIKANNTITLQSLALKFLHQPYVLSYERMANNRYACSSFMSWLNQVRNCRSGNFFRHTEKNVNSQPATMVIYYLHELVAPKLLLMQLGTGIKKLIIFNV